MEIDVVENPSREVLNEIEKFEKENFVERKEDWLAHEERNRRFYFSVPRAYLIAREEGQMIGTVFLHERSIGSLHRDDREIHLGGIGGVCVHKDLRRRGIGTKLIQDAMGILRRWECDIAYLCANIKKNGHFYRNVGFIPLGRKYSFIDSNGKKQYDDDGMIAPVCSNTVFEKVLNSNRVLHIGDGNW